MFIDGVERIGFGRGVVRIDFYGLSSTLFGEDKQPLPEFRQRLVMSPEGFLDTLAAMQGLATKLQEAGMMPRRAPPAPQPPTMARDSASGAGAQSSGVIAPGRIIAPKSSH
ncbi:MAG: hypothetical protein GC191_20285 [Azospirillum sp.]|nr:hypothetical protein [Azospirillum sp.]